MSSIQNSVPVTFAKKRTIYLPWQEKFAPIEESEVVQSLVDGFDLMAQGPNQSTPLRIRGMQDYEEFQSFRNQKVSDKVSDPETAKNLLRLKDEGASFFAMLNDERQQVGAYGAYNFLTGQLALNTLEVVFSQAVPNFEVKDKARFEDLTTIVDLSDSLADSVALRHREQHQNLLFQAALAEPGLMDAQSLARSAAKKLETKGLEVNDENIELVHGFFHSFKGPQSRLAQIDGIVNALDSKGNREIKNLKSVVALYDAAMNLDGSDENYFNEVLKEAPFEDGAYLTRVLGKDVFPEKFRLCDELTSHSHDFTKAQNQKILLRAMVQNPTVKDPRELLQLASALLGDEDENIPAKTRLYEAAVRSLASENKFAQSAVDVVDSRDSSGIPYVTKYTTKLAVFKTSLEPNLTKEEFAMSSITKIAKEDWSSLKSALAYGLNPQMKGKIDNWLVHSGKRNQPLHRDWLEHTMALKPGLKSPSRIMNALSGFVKNTWPNYRAVNDLYSSILQTQVKEGNGHAKFALEMTEAKNGNTKVDRDKSKRVLLQGALEQWWSDSRYANYVLEHAEKSDRDTLAISFLPRYFPERSKVVEDLTMFSPEDDKEQHVRLLSEAALKEEAESPLELVKSALKTQVSQRSGFFELKTELYRLLAKSKAQSDPDAKFLVRLADSKEADGDDQVKRTRSRFTLYEHALKPDLEKDELMNSVLESSRPEDQSYIRRAMAEEYYPELGDRVDDLIAFSSPDDSLEHWDIVFRAVQKNPDETDSSKIVREATSLLSGGSKGVKTANKLYESVLKKSAGTNHWSRAVLKISRDPFQDRRLSSENAIKKLYEEVLDSPSFTPHRIIGLLESAEESDRGVLTEELWMTFLHDPKLQAPPEVLEKARSGALSTAFIRDLCETLYFEAFGTGTGSEPNIEVQDDHLVVGDQLLDVDLG